MPPAARGPSPRVPAAAADGSPGGRDPLAADVSGPRRGRRGLRGGRDPGFLLPGNRLATASGERQASRGAPGCVAGQAMVQQMDRAGEMLAEGPELSVVAPLHNEAGN